MPLKRFIDAVKRNYGYYRAGVAETEKQRKRAVVESNIRGVRNANPSMADRMEAEYKKLKNKGVY